MKALYIHGAFSAFKTHSEKVVNLQKEFDVVGINYSTESSFEHNKAMMIKFCEENDIDFVVGTSLGGLYASEVSSELSIPAIMINPCVEPVMSLGTLLDGKDSQNFKNFTTGLIETLTKETISTYPEKANVTDKCLIFVGMKDDLIDSQKTIDMFKDRAKVISDPNEDHYWESFESNTDIKQHLLSKKKPMKELLLHLIENSIGDEMDIFYNEDIESIKSLDSCYEDIKPCNVDIYLDIVTKPDFSVLENEIGIKLHPELVEYWSQIWCPSFTILNSKSITQHHQEKNVFVNLLRSPNHLIELIEDVEMYTEEMNELGVSGVFLPIAFKDDGWNVLFNNSDGCVYVQDHDPCDFKKVSESIIEFYT